MSPSEQFLANREAIIAYLDGKPVQYLSMGQWHDEVNGAYPGFEYCAYRPKPLTIKMEYRIALMRDEGYYLRMCMPHCKVEDIISSPRFVKWVTDWTTVEHTPEG